MRFLVVRLSKSFRRIDELFTFIRWKRDDSGAEAEHDDRGLSSLLSASTLLLFLFLLSAVGG